MFVNPTVNPTVNLSLKTLLFMVEQHKKARNFDGLMFKRTGFIIETLIETIRLVLSGFKG